MSINNISHECKRCDTKQDCNFPDCPLPKLIICDNCLTDDDRKKLDKGEYP